MPPRSAVVGFAVEDVYAIAELLRRQKGGAAVVMGALSPRTRNAQVALYQNGDVDYLVATDAIGMGLNLDLDHVAFAQNRKFDGYQFRDLSAAELGQIAGRAGRHLRDGTFGVTGQVDPFADELVDKIETHDFDPVKVLQWRTAEFDFSSLDALRRSIESPAPVEGLTRALPAVDQQALEHLSAEPAVRGLATGAERVSLLNEFRTDDFQDVVTRLVHDAREHWRDDRGELPPLGFDPAYDALRGIADEAESSPLAVRDACAHAFDVAERARAAR